MRGRAGLALVVAALLSALGLLLRGSLGERADFTFVNHTEPRTLDPGRVTGHPEGRIVDALFEGLLYRDPQTLEPRPGVAERWEVTPDGRTYVFHLRPEARWSDGRRVTAHDFAWSWRRLLDPAHGGEYAYLLYGLRGARAWNAEGEASEAAGFGLDLGVYARDERTLVVELVAPIPYFLDLCTFYPTFPVPRHVVEQPGNARDWFLPHKIVSNGPFVLARWRVGDHIRLVRSDAYWGRDAVPTRTIDALPIENGNTALNLYLNGEVEWISDYPVDLARALREHPDYYSNAALYAYFYRINTTRPPFDDPRVRWALALAIDRRQIVEEVLSRGELPARHFVPPGLADYEPPQSRVRFDPEAARALLAEAGYPEGQGFPEVGLLYNTLESHKKVAELIADQWLRHLGVRIVPYNQEWQAYLASIEEGDYQLARAGWVGDYLDPNTFLDMWISGGGNNHSGWGDPGYDRLIALAADVGRYVDDPSLLPGLVEPERALALREEVLAAPDDETRRSTSMALRMHLLREAESILVARDLPFIPIYVSTFSGLVRPEVEGFYSQLVLADGRRLPNLQDIHPLRGIRVVER